MLILLSSVYPLFPAVHLPSVELHIALVHSLSSLPHCISSSCRLLNTLFLPLLSQIREPLYLARKGSKFHFLLQRNTAKKLQQKRTKFLASQSTGTQILKRGILDPLFPSNLRDILLPHKLDFFNFGIGVCTTSFEPQTPDTFPSFAALQKQNKNKNKKT